MTNQMNPKKGLHISFYRYKKGCLKYTSKMTKDLTLTFHFKSNHNTYINNSNLNELLKFFRCNRFQILMFKINKRIAIK